MLEKITPENLKEYKSWKASFDAMIVAYEDACKNLDDEEKHEKYKQLWKFALKEATTTEEMEALQHYIPTDHAGDYHSEAQKEEREKWDELEKKEIDDAKDNLSALKHAYDHSPSDEYREKALARLIEAIGTEKDARDFHKNYVAGSDVSRALEKKFPKLFAKQKETASSKEADVEDGGLLDIGENEITLSDDKETAEEEKKSHLIKRIWEKLLGLK
jgi:hypothetical protein